MGRQNIITTDLAPLNCFLNFLVMILIVLAAQTFVKIGSPIIYASIAAAVYILQLLEAILLATTLKLLWNIDKCIDL